MQEATTEHIQDEEMLAIEQKHGESKDEAVDKYDLKPLLDDGSPDEWRHPYVEYLQTYKLPYNLKQ